MLNGIFCWHVCASVKYLGDAHGHKASLNVPYLCSEIANYQACGYLMSDAIRGTIRSPAAALPSGTVTVSCLLARLVIGGER